MKDCSKCKVNKDFLEFPKNKRYKSGFNSICKTCVNSINKQYRDNNKESFKNSRKSYYQDNIIKMREVKKEYYRQNKEAKKHYDELYREKNKEKIKSYKKQWERINKENPIFKIKKNLRRRVHHAIQGNNKSDNTFNLIGCSPMFFKEYIESLFTEGMSWDNYGEWHIDHIVECFRFDLSLKEDQKKCFHYTNQRPLWKKDNLSRPRNT